METTSGNPRAILNAMKMQICTDTSNKEFIALRDELRQTRARGEFIAREAREAILGLQITRSEAQQEKLGEDRIQRIDHENQAYLQAEIDQELSLAFACTEF